MHSPLGLAGFARAPRGAACRGNAKKRRTRGRSRRRRFEELERNLDRSLRESSSTREFNVGADARQCQFVNFGGSALPAGAEWGKTESKSIRVEITNLHRRKCRAHFQLLFTTMNNSLLPSRRRSSAGAQRQE